MPFDPKLIHADEPALAANGDLNLPPDLAALGDQLRDDASHLAACYPAVSTLAAPILRTNAARRLSIAVIVSASAVSLAALLAGFVTFSQSPESDRKTHSREPSGPHFVTTAAPSDITISLTELSAPEVEALLDLTERSLDSTIRVSF
jgi:hypothetical protein